MLMQLKLTRIYTRSSLDSLTNVHEARTELHIDR